MPLLVMDMFAANTVACFVSCSGTWWLMLGLNAGVCTSVKVFYHHSWPGLLRWLYDVNMSMQ